MEYWDCTTKYSKAVCCRICGNIMTKATRLICGHTFCYECINGISKKAGFCTFGCETNFKLTSRNFVIEGIVEELIGECIKCREWKGGFE